MQYRFGLVLSGGGIRAVAQAGVLAALAEEGIEPDCVSGTSAGALVGALHAAGRTPREIVDFFALRSPFKLTNFALGKPGWIDADKIVADFGESFPDDSFAALGKRLFVTATDLVRARVEVFADGPLIRPLVASSAVPFAFTPVAIDGRLFADGGILNNFPVEPLLGLCDTLIGVHVSSLRQIAPKELGSSLAVAQRAFEVGMFHASQRQFHRCDLVLRPPGLGRFGLFDVKEREEIFAIGLEAGREALPEIRRLLARS